MEKSQVHFYSMGIVAKDKERKSTRIEVIPIEVNFINPTKVESTTEEVENTHATDSATDNLKIKKGNAITAQWWKFNSNRVNPPDVCKEDQVLILRLGDTDIYFWMDLGSSNVKRVEDAVYAWAADNNNQMADDLSNAYVLNVSTADQHITLRTCKVNGEKAAFLFQFNTRDGTWICKDDRGNKYYLNSMEDDLGFENAMLSKININKENAFIFAKNSVNVETKLMNIKCEAYTNNASKSVDYTTKKWKATSPESEFTGDVLVGKDFTYNGKGKGVGTFTVSEAIIKGITFSVHTHKEQGDGNDVSVPH